MNLTEWSKVILDEVSAKGFQCPDGIETPEAATQMMEKLMLVVTEVGEAAEAVRHDDVENFKEEIADSIIRLLHIAGAMGIDIELEVGAKMRKNADRPYLHGKRL
jgi:NTP pyrophosphatase (non-canonical NTP hydrolase)